MRRNAGGARHAEGGGQGAHAARWLVRLGGRVVAGRVARCAAHEHMARTPMGRRWMAAVVLPLMEGQQQAARTRCPRRTAKILQACQALQAQCATHPMPQTLAPEVRAEGQAWAAERAQTFQRASSAVEGRNGYLSQMHHNHRGLPKGRYKVWTVLHNFDGRASDGTTPASRFFRRDFPDLFETVLSQIEELPRSRRRNQTTALSG